MADETIPVNATGAQLSLQKVYIKDASFEAPGAPASNRPICWSLRFAHFPQGPPGRDVAATSKGARSISWR